jgi:hypothetical protein
LACSVVSAREVRARSSSARAARAEGCSSPAWPRTASSRHSRRGDAELAFAHAQRHRAGRGVQAAQAVDQQVAQGLGMAQALAESADAIG